MFAFPSHQMFMDPWARQSHMPAQFEDLGMPWFGPEATLTTPYAPRRAKHPRDQRTKDHVLMEQLARHGGRRPDVPRQPDSHRPIRQARTGPGTPQASDASGSTSSAHSAGTASSGSSSYASGSSGSSYASGSSSTAASSCSYDSTADTAVPMDACSPPAAPAQLRHSSSSGGKQQQHDSSSSMTPAQAATVIQATWRMSRLARHRQSFKHLTAAAAQLHSTRTKFLATKQECAAACIALTQKQYLELSEPIMKVLFQLDEVSCGGVTELRTLRKRLSTAANGLLDEMQAAYKQQPAFHGNVQQQQQQRQQQHTPSRCG